MDSCVTSIEIVSEDIQDYQFTKGEVVAREKRGVTRKKPWGFLTKSEREKRR